MHACVGHKAGVYSLSWSPFQENLLASSGEDRRVYIWDLDRVGTELRTDEEREEGPPELLFIHGGHTAKVFDFSWNANKDFAWYLASVAEDNVIHIWQVAESIYTDYQEDGESENEMDGMEDDVEVLEDVEAEEEVSFRIVVLIVGC
jgi:WD40 repeat protein